MRNMDSISPRDEIHFFKKQKPYIRGKLIFYLELNDFLIDYPVTKISDQRSYINEQIAKLKAKRAEDFQFAKYCKLEATKFDQIYFLRADHQLDLFMNKDLDDPEFSTSHDFLAAQIVTFDLLMTFYVEELSLLKPKKGNVVIEDIKSPIFDTLKWNGTKTDLVEFIYGMDASGAVGNPGPANIKKMVKLTQLAFKIDLGNYQKTFNEIKARNKDQTRFMDSVTAALNDRIGLV